MNKIYQLKSFDNLRVIVITLFPQNAAVSYILCINASCLQSLNLSSRSQLAIASALMVLPQLSRLPKIKNGDGTCWGVEGWLPLWPDAFERAIETGGERGSVGVVVKGGLLAREDADEPWRLSRGTRDLGLAIVKKFRKFLVS